MTAKELKVKEINEAISRSSLAKDLKAKAEIKDGCIQYSMLTRGQRPYRIKVTFRQILNLLHGEEIRRLAKNYSR